MSQNQNNTEVVNVNEIKGNKVSRTQALNLMKNNKGRFFTATFVNKEKKLRTINGRWLKDQGPSELGYVKVVESAGYDKTQPNKSIRNVNLQTLEELKIAGKTLQVG